MNMLDFKKLWKSYPFLGILFLNWWLFVTDHLVVLHPLKTFILNFYLKFGIAFIKLVYWKFILNGLTLTFT